MTGLDYVLVVVLLFPVLCLVWALLHLRIVRVGLGILGGLALALVALSLLVWGVTMLPIVAPSSPMGLFLLFWLLWRDPPPTVTVTCPHHGV